MVSVIKDLISIHNKNMVLTETIILNKGRNAPKHTRNIENDTLT